MAYVVKTMTDGEYMTEGPACWSKHRRDAARFASRKEAETMASNVRHMYEPRVVKLVPRRKARTADTGSAVEERVKIIAWLEQEPSPCGELRRAAERILAGAHRVPR